MKNKEVIELLLGYHPSFPKEYNGCDTYKFGSGEEECTGIVVALVPTIHVIRKAIALHANLIIVHEPTFYTSNDDEWNENFHNQVFEEKKALLEKYNITIWRDHDHMHAHQPDQIFTGIVEYLGWTQKYYVNRDTGGYAHHVCEIEPMKLIDICNYLCEKIGLHGVRYIGNPTMKIRKLAFVGHLYPEKREKEYSVQIIREFEENGVELILPLETIDWTVNSYIRDGLQLGKKVAMISAGHFNIEELGMKYLTEKIKELVNDRLDVTYVPSEDMYEYYRK